MGVGTMGANQSLVDRACRYSAEIRRYWAGFRRWVTSMGESRRCLAGYLHWEAYWDVSHQCWGGYHHWVGCWVGYHRTMVERPTGEKRLDD